LLTYKQRFTQHIAVIIVALAIFVKLEAK